MLRLKLLLLEELPNLERELVLLDKELEPVLRLEVLRAELLDACRAELLDERLFRDELTDDCRAARLDDWRLDDCKDLELLELLDDDLELLARLEEFVDDDRELLALLELFEADRPLEPLLFFWKPAAEVMLKPIIPRVTAAIIAQANGFRFVLSTCHFMTCTPIFPVENPGFNIRNVLTVSHHYFRLSLP
ncbi:MAG: hypothetical protein GY869_10590 [Planctomycetes bacterium]|nr:hypothetical protein [Planctomycetota bacterium]